MGVEPFELYAGVGWRELPIGLGVVVVAVVLPSGDLRFGECETIPAHPNPALDLK